MVRRRQPPSRSAHRHETAQQQENIQAVETSRPPRSLLGPTVFLFFLNPFCVDRVLKDAFRTLTVLCTVIVKDETWPRDSFSLVGQGSINKDYFSLSCALPALTLPPPVVESSVMKFS